MSTDLGETDSVSDERVSAKIKEDDVQTDENAESASNQVLPDETLDAI